ncbi:MAG: hypothetical protein KAI70_03790 [Candidatus Omnitrophica bacterium]|nr:hypothetical protein [Candidatus Omnitrophota bacterium]
MKKGKYRNIFVLLIAVQCCVTQGCLRSSSEIETIILEHDPDFKETLNKKDHLLTQLDSKRSAFLKKKAEINENIVSLKNDKVRLDKNYSREKQEIKRLIQPDRRKLERELIDAERSHKNSLAELGNINRDIKEISALVQKKDKLLLTSEEIRTWKDKLSSLTIKKEGVEKSKDEIRKQIEIIKLKLKVVKV